MAVYFLIIISILASTWYVCRYLKTVIEKNSSTDFDAFNVIFNYVKICINSVLLIDEEIKTLSNKIEDIYEDTLKDKKEKEQLLAQIRLIAYDINKEALYMSDEDCILIIKNKLNNKERRSNG